MHPLYYAFVIFVILIAIIGSIGNFKFKNFLKSFTPIEWEIAGNLYKIEKNYKHNEHSYEGIVLKIIHYVFLSQQNIGNKNYNFNAIHNIRKGLEEKANKIGLKKDKIDKEKDFGAEILNEFKKTKSANWQNGASFTLDTHITEMDKEALLIIMETEYSTDILEGSFNGVAVELVKGVKKLLSISNLDAAYKLQNELKEAERPLVEFSQGLNSEAPDSYIPLLKKFYKDYNSLIGDLKDYFLSYMDRNNGVINNDYYIYLKIKLS